MYVILFMCSGSQTLSSSKLLLRWSLITYHNFCWKKRWIVKGEKPSYRVLESGYAAIYVLFCICYVHIHCTLLMQCAVYTEHTFCVSSFCTPVIGLMSIAVSVMSSYSANIKCHKLWLFKKLFLKKFCCHLKIKIVLL